MTKHRGARRYLIVFYVVVAAIAATGAGQAATTWLHWWPIFAFAAVAAVEAGGAVISRHALDRRLLGERATVARLLSALVAAGAVAVNWFGHVHVGQAAFFAGMSLLGYCVWLLDSEAQRRDQLRAEHRLAATPPAYGLWQWLRHPAVTALARRLARQDAALGWVRSLETARAQLRAEVRQRAIAVILHRKLRTLHDPAAADLAIAVYDLDEIAARLADAADYDGLAGLLAVELSPRAVAGVEPAGQLVDEPAVDMPVDTTTDMESAPDTDPASNGITDGAVSELGMSTPDAILTARAMRAYQPDMPVDKIAAIVGRSERSVRRYLDEPATDRQPAPTTGTAVQGSLDDVLTVMADLDLPARRDLAEQVLFGQQQRINGKEVAAHAG